MSTNLTVVMIKTKAGTGDSGWSGDGGAALAACLNEPKSLTLDAEGNLFIADSENHVIRKIDRKTNSISTVAGFIQGVAPIAAPVAPTPVVEGVEDDPLAESDSVASHAFTQQTDLSGTVRYMAAGTAPAKRFSGDGGPANHALLNFPTAVAVDRAGHLYIADTLNHRVRRVHGMTGVITTVAGVGQPRYSGDGGLAVEAGLHEPAGLVVSDGGVLYIADQSNNRVRAVDLATGMIRTVAGTGTAAYNGDGMVATETGLAGPGGLALASDGTLLIADSFSGRIRAVDLVTGFIRTVVGGGGEYRYEGPDEPPGNSLSRPSGIALDGEGNIFFTDSDNHLVRRWDRTTKLIERIAGIGVASYGGDGGAARDASLSYPFGIVMDRSGCLLVADTFNHRIREIAL
ncbi:MAG: Serine/threonine-protein kinase PknD [Nitrospira sp.]|nr:Serine/threonine-protein kinase PknD [Nitrospira sp.]